MNRLRKAARRQERHERQKERRALRKAQASGDNVSGVVEELDGIDPEEIRNAPIIDETGTEPIDDEDDDEYDDDDEDDDLDEDETGNRLGKSSKVKKNMDEPAMAGPYIGPTSFDELDAQHEAMEKQRMVMETGYNVQDLVRNIINHPLMDSDEKAAAIEKAGKEFGTRVSKAISGKVVKKDMEALEIEAILAQDRRHTSVGEILSDFFAKATLSSASREAKPDSDFALITSKDGKKTRKYPIHDKAHVRNALARAAQMIKRGGEAASDAKAALPKIRAAAKKMGIEMSMEKNASAILVQKDKSGDWRWVGWPSNNFIDRDGDILSKQAHEEYVAWLDQHPDMAPLFMTWHTPGTARKNPADYWHVEKGFLIMSGKLEETEAAGLLEAMKEVDLGMSIQGLGLREDADPRVITKYRAFEVSDLPLEKAANPFTDFAVIDKEVDVDKKAYLAKIMGSEDAAEKFLEKTGLKQQALSKAGIESKAQKEGVLDAQAIAEAIGKLTGQEVDVEIEETDEETPEVKKAEASGDSEAIVKMVMDKMDVEGLATFVKEAQEAMEKVPVLEELVKALTTRQDERLAEAISPPAGRFPWSHGKRASTSDATKIKKEDDADAKLLESTPGLGDHWLSEATGVPAVKSPVQ